MLPIRPYQPRGCLRGQPGHYHQGRQIVPLCGIGWHQPPEQTSGILSQKADLPFVSCAKHLLDARQCRQVSRKPIAQKMVLSPNHGLQNVRDCRGVRYRNIQTQIACRSRNRFEEHIRCPERNFERRGRVILRDEHAPSHV